MIQGHVYKVRHQMPGVERYARESVMTFLGQSSDGRQLQFSARPTAGTQVLHSDWIQKVEDLGPSEGREDQRHYLNRRAPAC